MGQASGLGGRGEGLGRKGGCGVTIAQVTKINDHRKLTTFFFKYQLYLCIKKNIETNYKC